jgi:imidazolonepropionase-like amidohydrolase
LASKEPSGEAMNRRIWVLAIGFIAVILALPTIRIHPTAASADPEVVAFVGAKIYTSPTDPPISNGIVVVHSEKIEAVGIAGTLTIPAGAKHIDCKGAVITAAFQNSHVHFTEPKWTDAAKQPAEKLTKQLSGMFVRYGFTTVVDTGSFLLNTVAIRKRIASGEVAGSRILTAGTPLYPPDGIPYYLSDLPPEIRKIIPQPATPAAAIGFVNDDLAGGADIIKLFTGSWIARGKVKPMPVDVAIAAVEEAHKHGKLVFTHPSNVAGLEVALAAHVDVLAHSIEDMRGWNNSYLTRMKAANMALIPTLKLFGSDDDLPGILDEVGSYQRMGGQILFGTDVGFLPDYDPSNEYSLMSRAGLTPMQILASLTTAPAERFGESDKRGRLTAGMQADLVVFSADPATDATNFAKVRYTVRGGRIVYSASAN